MVAFVTALEPEKFKISCLDRFLATIMALTLQGSLNFLAHILDLMWLRFCWVLRYYFCFVLTQNEFFNVSSALKEYCFFHAKKNSHRRLRARTGFWPLLYTCTFFGGSAQLSCALIFNARGYVFVEHYRVIFVLFSRKMNSLLYHLLPFCNNSNFFKHLFISHTRQSFTSDHLSKILNSFYLHFERSLRKKFLRLYLWNKNNISSM